MLQLSLSTMKQSTMQVSYMEQTLPTNAIALEKEHTLENISKY